MKIAVIGADTNLGKKLVLDAEANGISVVACTEKFTSLVGNGKLVIKTYDSLTLDDFANCHYVIDAISFMHIRKYSTELLPVWHLLELLKNSSLKLLELGSCAFLYTDKSKNTYVANTDAYALDDEQNTKDRLCINAYERLCHCTDVQWSVLCPPLLLDPHAYGTGEIEFSEDILCVGLEGDSFISEVDFAKATIELLKRIPKVHSCMCVRSLKKAR
ncbi:MAG: hypothetical protein GX278_03230 [Aeromonadales bacterium]|nr:hypothetical protein [Aeromonadales bacterium]